MTTTASVSIDRTSLGLSPLVISGDGSGTYSLTAAGLGRPLVTARYTYADASADVEGQVLLQAVRDTSALPLEVLVQANTYAALQDALDALADAVWQFTYTTTTTVAGVSRSWRCQPCAPQVDEGVITHARADQHLAVAALTIPVNPTPGG